VRFEVASSARTSRGGCLALVVQPSSPPWRAIRSSFARRLQSRRPRLLGEGVGMELFPMDACRILSSPLPSLRSWRRRGSCVVPARAMVLPRYPSRLRKSRAELLGNPFLLRLGGGYMGSMRRRVVRGVLSWRTMRWMLSLSWGLGSFVAERVVGCSRMRTVLGRERCAVPGPGSSAGSSDSADTIRKCLSCLLFSRERRRSGRS